MDWMLFKLHQHNEWIPWSFFGRLMYQLTHSLTPTSRSMHMYTINLELDMFIVTMKKLRFCLLSWGTGYILSQKDYRWQFIMAAERYGIHSEVKNMIPIVSRTYCTWLVNNGCVVRFLLGAIVAFWIAFVNICTTNEYRSCLNISYSMLAWMAWFLLQDLF